MGDLRKRFRCELVAIKVSSRWCFWHNPWNFAELPGRSLYTTGIKKAELVATTMDGEEVLLQHDFIVGNVTSCLVSLGQLYQGGWTIHKDQESGDLSLMSPGDEIRNPIEYRNKSFAIKAHVRQVVDATSSTNMASGLCA